MQVGSVIHVPFEAPSQAADYNNPNTGYIPAARSAPRPAGGRDRSHRNRVPLRDHPHLPPLRRPGVRALGAPAHGGANTSTSSACATVRRHTAVRPTRRAAEPGHRQCGASSEDGTAATIQGPSTRRPSGGGSSPRSPRSSGWRSSARPWPARAPSRARTIRPWSPSACPGGSSSRCDMARNLVVGLAGAVGAVVIATLLSPIAPLGEARLAEDSTGVAFDSFVLLLGALATVVVVLALGVWPALRAARTRRMTAGWTRPAPRRWCGTGQAWARHQLRSSASATPWSADPADPPFLWALPCLGMVLAVIALCATGVFGASLTHLTATPRLCGRPGADQLQSAEPGTAQASLERNPAVTAITEGVGAGDVVSTGRSSEPSSGTSVKGPLPLLDGRPAILRSATTRSGSASRPCAWFSARIGSVVHITFTTHSGAPRDRAVPGGLPGFLPAVRGVREPRHAGSC